MNKFTPTIPLLILLTIFFTPSCISQPQTLRAVECNASLISKRSATVSIYDGEETIYIFGGFYYDPVQELIPYADIHAYNITSDTIQVTAQLPRTSWDGITHLNPESGEIYLLRGDGTFLWSFDPITQITVSVTQWFGNSASVTGAFTKDNKLLTFGGLEDARQVYQYDFTTQQQGPYGNLPLSSQASVGIHMDGTNKTYIFAGELGNRNPILMRYDHLTNSTTILDTVFPSWRHGDGYLVAKGEDIYIIGAVVDNGARGNGIIRYGTRDNVVNYIDVKNLPVQLTASSAVYVESLDRIYIFGGYDLRNIDREEIWYVDLLSGSH